MRFLAVLLACFLASGAASAQQLICPGGQPANGQSCTSGGGGGGMNTNGSNATTAALSNIVTNAAGSGGTTNYVRADGTFAPSVAAGGGLSLSGITLQLGALSAVPHEWISSINSAGSPLLTQPMCADLSDAQSGCMTAVGTLATQNANMLDVTGVAQLTGLPAPLNPTDAVTKSYVDAGILSNTFYHQPVYVATTGVLPNSPTYNNGSGGIGATLTGGANVALVVDSQSITTLGTRVLVSQQAAAAQNGIYTLTQDGSGGSQPWILTRATDFDMPTVGNIALGAAVFVTNGTSPPGGNENLSFWMNQSAAITVGTTAITWVQSSASATYGANAPLTLSSSNFGFQAIPGSSVVANTGGSSATPSNSVVYGMTGNSVLLETGMAGTISPSVLPDPSSSTLGGVLSAVAPTHEVFNSISTSGAPGAVQLGVGDLSSVTGPVIIGRTANTSGPLSPAYTPSNATDTTVPLVHGATVSGHCPQFSDTTGTLVDSGNGCGGSGGGSVPVNNTISSATTLSNSDIGANPVIGAGYTITVPASGITASQPITLVAQPGTGPVDVCPAASASFATNSGAPLVPGICSGGNPGAVIYNGLTLTVIYVSGGSYFVALSAQAPQAVNPQAYYVGDGTAASPTIFANTSAAASSGSTLTFSAVPAGVFVGMVVQDATTPNGLKGETTMTAFTGSTVTLSQAVNGSGVGSGDRIAFVSHGRVASDSNPGTLAAPFSTIQHCVFAVAANASGIDTCYVRKGTYDFTYAGPWFTACGGSTQSYAVGINAVSAGTLSGLTISYYPPDGIGSAQLIGPGGGGSAIGYALCVYNGAGFTTNHITVTGLSFQNWDIGAFASEGTDSTGGDVFSWNSLVGTVTTANDDAVQFAFGSGKNASVLNNYISGTKRAAITFKATGAFGNVLIAGNILDNDFVQGTPDTDQGDIYIWQGTSAGVCAGISSTGNLFTVTGNYIDRGISGANDTGIYFDDQSCYGMVTNNVIISPGNHCALIHGGNNVVFENNVCDEGPNENGGLAAIVNYANDGVAGPMTGNKWDNNVIVCNFTGGSSGCGDGYIINGGTPPANLEIKNNGYWNYNNQTHGIGGVNHTATGVGTETGATALTGGPGITCWAALVAASSPIFSDSIFSADLGRAWGPPGMIGPSQANQAPSWGPTC